MNQASTINPALSPAFDRTRKLSRIMAVIFTIGFWAMLVCAVLLLTIPIPQFCPNCTVTAPALVDITVSLNGLSSAQRVWVLLAMEIVVVPVVFLMHHTRRVFEHFAKGEIFGLPVIDHVRRTGLWLIISFFANIASHAALNVAGMMPRNNNTTAWPLVIGVVTFIAASVMAEACRIASDNAEIV